MANKTEKKKSDEPQECSICGEAIEIQRFGNGHTWSEGHNAEPVASGSCCGVCNIAVVIPTRIRAINQKENTNEKSVQ